MRASAQTILSRSATALAHAQSFHLSGSIEVSGQSGRVDFWAGGPNRGRGWFQLGSTSFSFTEVHGTDYLLSRTLWKQVGGGVLAPLLDGRWVSIPANDPMAQQLTQAFGSLTSAIAVAAVLKAHGTGARRLGPRSVLGQQTVAVSVPKLGTVYVAANGAPYPLRMARPHSGTVNLDHFRARIRIDAPAHPVSLLDVIHKLGAGQVP